MTPATILILLGAPGLWLGTSTDPPAACLTTRDVCLMETPREVVLTRRSGGVVTFEPLAGRLAELARNLVALKIAEAAGLARDREARVAGDVGR